MPRARRGRRRRRTGRTRAGRRRPPPGRRGRPRERAGAATRRRAASGRTARTRTGSLRTDDGRSAFAPRSRGLRPARAPRSRDRGAGRGRLGGRAERGWTRARRYWNGAFGSARTIARESRRAGGTAPAPVVHSSPSERVRGRRPCRRRDGRAAVHLRRGATMPRPFRRFLLVAVPSIPVFAGLDDLRGTLPRGRPPRRTRRLPRRTPGDDPPGGPTSRAEERAVEQVPVPRAMQRPRSRR